MEGVLKLLLVFVYLQGAVDAFNCGNANFSEVSYVEVIYTPSDNCRQFTRRFFAPTGRAIAGVALVMGPTANCTAITPSGVAFETFSHGVVAIEKLVDGVVLDCRTGVNDAITFQIISYNQTEVCPSINPSLTPGSSASVGNYDGNTNYLPQQLCVWTVQATNASDNCNFTFVNTGVQNLPPGDFVTITDPATGRGLINPLTGVHTVDNRVLLVSFLSNNNTETMGVNFTFTRCGQPVIPIVAATQAPTAAPATTPVLPPIVCSISPSFNLSSDMLRMLNASSTDQLIISPTYVEDISTVSSKCKALGSQPTFHFNLTDCPAVYKSNGTHLSVTYVIRNKAVFNRPSVIQRFKDIAMNITCDFKTQEMINFAQIIPEIQKIQVFQTSVRGRFDIDFGFYNSNSFSVKLAAGSTVSVPNPVYARIGLANIPSNVRNLIVQTKRCWATNTMHPNSTRNYNLISQSCPADSYTTVTRNHNSSYTTFEFKSFIWTNVTLSSQQIYVHCEVTICDQNLNATCNTLNCASGRRRRDASTNPYKIISAGPVLIATSIDDDTRPCEQNDYCSDVCTMMGGKPVCSCGEGLELGEDMRTCVELPNEDSNTLVYLMGISLVLLLGIIAMKKFNA